MSGIGIITNPHSRLNKKKPERQALLGYILGEQGRLEITQSLEDLRKTARHFKSSNIEILAINGGDGTISQTLTAFINEYQETPLPKIALLGGGTMNVLARNMGIRGTPESRVFRLVDGFSSGIAWQTKKVRTLCIEGQYGFLYADGVAPAYLHEFYKRKSNALGVLWLALKIACSNILNTAYAKSIIKDETAKIDYGAGKLEESSIGVFAASLEKISFNMKLFPDVWKSLEKFQFFNLRCPARQMVMRLPWICLKNGIQDNSIKYSQLCESLEVSREAPFDYTLDGELFRSPDKSLKIELGPTLDFIVK